MLEGSSIIAVGSTEGITFGRNFDSITAQWWRYSSLFKEEMSRQQAKMIINNPQVSATAAALSGGNNIRQTAAQRELLLAASLTVCVAE